MNTLDYIIKKYNLTTGRQYIIEIPNIDRKNLANLFAELNFNTGAEIGVAYGDYSEYLCKVNPNLHLYSIDPWSLSAYEPDGLKVHMGQKKHNEQFKEARRRLKPYNCTVIRKMSMDVIYDFADESLDFVYIDGNHDFVNFTNDMYWWNKKVRVGGIVSGHDYMYYPFKNFNHVKYALTAYIRSYALFPLFIVGANIEGSIRDRVRSWFLVKTG